MGLVPRVYPVSDTHPSSGDITGRGRCESGDDTGPYFPVDALLYPEFNWLLLDIVA